MTDKEEKNKEIENYLYDYYYAKKAIRSLQCDLIAAQREYEDGLNFLPGHGYEAIRSKNKPITDPTAKAAEILAESLGKEVERISRSIADNEAILASREYFIKDLDGIEKEYVRFRYFEKRSIESVSHQMGYEPSTVYRVRNNALDKLRPHFKWEVRQSYAETI